MNCYITIQLCQELQDISQRMYHHHHLYEVLSEQAEMSCDITIFDCDFVKTCKLLFPRGALTKTSFYVFNCNFVQKSKTEVTATSTSVQENKSKHTSG